jgi:hypothetical protein
MALRLRRAAEQFPKAGWPVSDDELVVMHAGEVVGTLRRVDAGPQRGNWFWSITACYVPPGVMTLYGTEDSKEEAKAAFGKKFWAWLEWAGEKEQD